MSQGADAEAGKDGEQNKEVDSVFGKLSYFIRASMHWLESAHQAGWSERCSSSDKA